MWSSKFIHCKKTINFEDKIVFEGSKIFKMQCEEQTEAEKVNEEFDFIFLKLNINLSVNFLNGKKFKNCIQDFLEEFENNLRQRIVLFSHEKSFIFKKKIYLSYKSLNFCIFEINPQDFKVFLLENY